MSDSEGHGGEAFHHRDAEVMSLCGRDHRERFVTDGFYICKVGVGMGVVIFCFAETTTQLFNGCLWIRGFRRGIHGSWLMALGPMSRLMARGPGTPTMSLEPWNIEQASSIKHPGSRCQSGFKVLGRVGGRGVRDGTQLSVLITHTSMDNSRRRIEPAGGITIGFGDKLPFVGTRS